MRPGVPGKGACECWLEHAWMVLTRGLLIVVVVIEWVVLACCGGNGDGSWMGRPCDVGHHALWTVRR